MRILFDQGTPVPLRNYLSTHKVETATERGWSQLSNGALLDQAESEGFEALITTDQNLQYQQNLTGRSIAILVLTRASWPRIQAKISEVQAAADALQTGDYVEVQIQLAEQVAGGERGHRRPVIARSFWTSIVAGPPPQL